MLPDDTRLWAALIQASGGAWGGCVYDPDAITAALRYQFAEILKPRISDGIVLLPAESHFLYRI